MLEDVVLEEVLELVVEVEDEVVEEEVVELLVVDDEVVDEATFPVTWDPRHQRPLAGTNPIVSVQ